MILGGLGLLYAFATWTERRGRLGLDALLDLAMLQIVRMRAGLSTLFVQQLVILGIFFVLPVYLQIVLGLDAFETGKRLIPMSVMMLVAALAGPRLAARQSPRRVCQLGLGAIAIGSVIVLSTIDVELNELGFSIGLAVFGVGAGLLASQLGNVIMSSVDPSRTNEAGGLQGTAQNLGASFGTALIGAILLGGLTAGFVDRVVDNPAVPPEVSAEIAQAAEATGLQVITVDQAEQYLLDAGLPADQAAAVAADYGQAQLDGLRNALGAVAVFAVLGFWFTRRLPGRDEARAGAGETAA
jgi:Na+/melibiose symporter-like transporter